MIQVEHEIHGRRRGRNLGVGVLLGMLVAITFGVTVVKVTQLGAAGAFAQGGMAMEPATSPDPAAATP